MTGELSSWHDERLDVAIITPRYPPVSSGGGEKSAELLATNLIEDDRIGKVSVFSFDARGQTEQRDITVHRLGEVSPLITEYQNAVSILKLRGKLTNFDILHGYNMELHPAIGFISSRCDVPAVATLNSYHFFPTSVTNTSPEKLEFLYEKLGHPTTGRVLRHFIKRIDVFVTLSRAIREIYRSNGFESSRFEHVPNMVDPDFCASAGNESQQSVDDSRQIRVLYVGELSEKKGVSYLLRAIDLLPAEYHLRLVGTGEREASLKLLVEKRGLSNRVTFSGALPYEKINEVYTAADIFVHPGIWPEPLNRTLLEAMQSGLPVVCTDIGGPPEIVPDADCLCEPADADALAETIRRVRRKDGLGVANREFVTNNHSPSVVIPKIVDIYEELVG